MKKKLKTIFFNNKIKFTFFFLNFSLFYCFFLIIILLYLVDYVFAFDRIVAIVTAKTIIILKNTKATIGR